MKDLILILLLAVTLAVQISTRDNGIVVIMLYLYALINSLYTIFEKKG